MTVEYLDLTDDIAIAADVTGLGIVTVMKVTSLDLADSALHAPAAGFGTTDFYPDFVDKAAVLVVRLAGNHPLPDGNKRAAWVALRAFVDQNGWTWDPKPTLDSRTRSMLRSPSPPASGKRRRRGSGFERTSLRRREVDRTPSVESVAPASRCWQPSTARTSPSCWPTSASSPSPPRPLLRRPDPEPGQSAGPVA